MNGFRVRHYLNRSRRSQLAFNRRTYAIRSGTETALLVCKGPTARRPHDLLEVRIAVRTAPRSTIRRVAFSEIVPHRAESNKARVGNFCSAAPNNKLNSRYETSLITANNVKRVIYIHLAATDRWNKWLPLVRSRHRNISSNSNALSY